MVMPDDAVKRKTLVLVVKVRLPKEVIFWSLGGKAGRRRSENRGIWTSYEVKKKGTTPLNKGNGTVVWGKKENRGGDS